MSSSPADHLTRETVADWLAKLNTPPTRMLNWTEQEALARSWLEKDAEATRIRERLTAHGWDFNALNGEAYDWDLRGVFAAIGWTPPPGDPLTREWSERAERAEAEATRLRGLLDEIADHDTYHKNTCYLLANAGRAEECDCGGVQIERKITEALASKDKETL